MSQTTRPTSPPSSDDRPEQVQALVDDLEEHALVQGALEAHAITDESLWVWAEALYEKGWRRVP